MRTTGGVRAARRRALVLVGATLVALGVVAPPGAAAPAGPDPATAAGPAEDPWAGLDFGVLDVDLDLGILSDPQAVIDAEQLAESLHHQYRRVDAPAAEQAFADYGAVRAAVEAANPQLSFDELGEHPEVQAAAARVTEANARGGAAYDQWMNAQWAARQAASRQAGATAFGDMIPGLETFLEQPGDNPYGIQRVGVDASGVAVLQPAPDAVPDLFGVAATPMEIGRNLNPTGSAGSCGNVAMACDSWLAGRPASGHEWLSPPGHVRTAELTELFGPAIPMDGLAELVDLLPEPGDRGLVRATFARPGEDSVGHVWNAVNHDGDVYSINFGGTALPEDTYDLRLHMTGYAPVTGDTGAAEPGDEVRAAAGAPGADGGTDREGAGGGITIAPELPPWDPELDGSTLRPFPAPAPVAPQLETFPTSPDDLTWTDTGAPQPQPEDLWAPETFPLGEPAAPQVYTFPAVPEEELAAQMAAWQRDLQAEGVIAHSAAEVFNNHQQELSSRFGLSAQQATEALGGSYSNRVGQRITGPAIVGPAIVGPAIVGPAIVGPKIVGPAIVGEGIVGPCLDASCPNWGRINGFASAPSAPSAVTSGGSAPVWNPPAVRAPAGGSRVQPAPAAPSAVRRPEHDTVAAPRPQPQPQPQPNWVQQAGQAAWDVLTYPHPLDPVRGAWRDAWRYLPGIGPAGQREFAH